MRAWIVIDLGFGDAGKGLVTDALVRRTGARLVVRYNGGAQAGHNVVTADGRHHTFAQLGAGSFVPGTATILGPRVVVHPTALLGELRVLERSGVRAGEHLAIAADAPIITPYHQALNRLRELARGPARHGSCGVGVGETVAHGLAWPEERVVAGDLVEGARLVAKAEAVRARLRAEAERLAEVAVAVGRGVGDVEAGAAVLDAVRREREVFARDGLAAVWAEQAGVAGRWVIAAGEVAHRIAREHEVVFEGAQGVLLDEAYGFHPHTTWSRCTDVWARALAPEAEHVRVGVLRAFAVRHGAGPLPTEEPALAGVMRDHNARNPWQGAVRAGHFDAVLARYALAALGGVDRLVVTHLDALARAPWRAAHAYDLDGERIDALPVPAVPTLAGQEAVGARLARARPVLGDVVSTEAGVRGCIATLLDWPVDAVSRGPRAEDLEGFGV